DRLADLRAYLASTPVGTFAGTPGSATTARPGGTSTAAAAPVTTRTAGGSGAPPQPGVTADGRHKGKEKADDEFPERPDPSTTPSAPRRPTRQAPSAPTTTDTSWIRAVELICQQGDHLVNELGQLPGRYGDAGLDSTALTVAAGHVRGIAAK